MTDKTSAIKSVTNAEWRAFDQHITVLRHQGLLDQASSLAELMAHLSPSEKLLVDGFLEIDPADYGVTTPFLGIEATPANLVVLHEGHPNSRAADYATDRQYLPQTVATALQAMRAAFEADQERDRQPVRQLIVASGYRSPAFQVATLASYLVHFHNFDIASTLTQVALPSRSQHCSATNTALDLANLDGQPSDANGQDFAGTVEYRWLIAHAATYSFYESYPPANKQGIMWEPWHWQYLPNKH